MVNLETGTDCRILLLPFRDFELNVSCVIVCHIISYISYVSCVSSSVVGRERMGTAFPHKKLCGNGVPTREILRDILLLLLLN